MSLRCHRACDTVRHAIGIALRVAMLALAGMAAMARAAESDEALVSASTSALPLSGDVRLFGQRPSANPAGPLARAEALAPGIAPPPVSSATWQTQLRSHGRAWHADLLLGQQRSAGGAEHTTARVNELYGSADLTAWQLSAGKKVVSWDIGYAWRPNDMVQQEPRRTLGPVVLEGRPLLLAEYFADAERAFSLVWVEPQRSTRPDADPPGDNRESALAARAYQRFGALDAYLFGRFGRRTRGSVGAAAAWVASDALELHASARWLQRHDGWAPGGDGDSPAPWQLRTLGHAHQLLLGLNWTGTAQQSVLLEGWWDGSAPSDADWQRHADQQNALQAAAAQPGLTAEERIGLAAQSAGLAAPLSSPNLRRSHLYARLAWQPTAWTLAADLLVTPSDAGRIAGLSALWQGDRVSVELAWRHYGGPASALYAQLPSRQVALLATRWSF